MPEPNDSTPRKARLPRRNGAIDADARASRLWNADATSDVRSAPHCRLRRTNRTPRA